MGTFAGKPLFDPAVALAECRRLNFPVDHWLGKANRFACPAGTESGTGVVLMTRADLNRLDLNAAFDLVFTAAGDPPLKLKRIHVVRALCVTPGAPADPKALYAVELADVRRKLALTSGDRGFNLRTAPGGDFTALSAAGPTTPFTWAQIWGHLWALLPAGDAGAVPVLPAVPDGDPNGFDWFGLSAMQAIRQFLTRLSWDLVLDPVADTFSVVAVGDTRRVVRLSAADMQNAAALGNAKLGAGWQIPACWDHQPVGPEKRSGDDAAAALVRNTLGYVDQFALQGQRLRARVHIPDAKDAAQAAKVGHTSPCLDWDWIDAADVAVELRAWLATVPSGRAIWPGYAWREGKFLRVMRHDMAAAGIAEETEEGVIDFHSLRTTYITLLAKAGVPIQHVQKLARHAAPTTTAKHYIRLRLADLSGEVAKMPPLHPPESA